MDKDYIKKHEPEIQKEPVDSKKIDSKNIINKNYDYLEPGDTYNFEVGM